MTSVHDGQIDRSKIESYIESPLETILSRPTPPISLITSVEEVGTSDSHSSPSTILRRISVPEYLSCLNSQDVRRFYKDHSQGFFPVCGFKNLKILIDLSIHKPIKNICKKSLLCQFDSEFPQPLRFNLKSTALFNICC